MTIDTTNMCSHLQRKLFTEEGEYRAIREQIETDPTLTAVVRSRQLHIYRDGKKFNPYKFSILDDKYLLAIFMEEEGEQDTTTVQTSSTSVTFTWPFIVGGFSYSLTIYLDVACTIPFCTITFNQYGQLIGISFGNRAPRRSMEQEDGFTYTVSGLDANTEYYFKMETMDEDNKLINTDEGAFRTTNDATGIENQYNTVIEHRKVMINGQIYILRGDKTYTIQGQEVK